jgi:hypothetical protein
VVQSLVCKTALKRYLGQKFQSLGQNQFENIFQSYIAKLWSENGDNISMMYTGTGALKSEFTKTGKRTLAGTNEILPRYLF